MLDRIVSAVIGVLPGWVKVLLAALGSLALVFGAFWTVMHVRARRLGREGRQLSLDAGLLKRTLEPKTPGRLGSLAFSVAAERADSPPEARGFHDVFPLGANRAGIVIGQISRHGDTPLAEAVLVRHTLRAHLELGLPPRSTLRRAGELRRDNGTGGFASATVAVYDGAGGTLTYACAGHPTPLIFGSAADALAPVPHYSPPLGTGSECGQRQTVISLSPGSGACIYSDGVRWLAGSTGRIDRDAVAILEQEDTDAAGLLAHVAASGEWPNDVIVCVVRAALAGCVPPTHIEELVLRANDQKASNEFLLACGLAPRAAAEVSASAVDRALGTGSSVLRVSWGPDGPEHQILAYRTDSEWPLRPSVVAAAAL